MWCGAKFFHGARLMDAHAAAVRLKEQTRNNHSLLVGVGYSLGAIVLNNYIATYGEHVSLDVGISISGSLDCRFQEQFERSQRTWQPMFAAYMKENFLLRKWGNRLRQRLGRHGFQALVRATNIVVRAMYMGLCVCVGGCLARRLSSLLWVSILYYCCVSYLVPFSTCPTTINLNYYTLLWVLLLLFIFCILLLLLLLLLGIGQVCASCVY